MRTKNGEYYNKADFYNICFSILTYLNINEIYHSKLDGNPIFKIDASDIVKMNFIRLFFEIDYVNSIEKDERNILKIINFSDNGFKKYKSVIRNYKLKRINAANIYN